MKCEVGFYDRLNSPTMGQWLETTQVTSDPGANKSMASHSGDEGEGCAKIPVTPPIKKKVSAAYGPAVDHASKKKSRHIIIYTGRGDTRVNVTEALSLIDDLTKAIASTVRAGHPDN